ncbi:MAG TPA: hypothetical protein VMS98_16905 [Thermoanaerobaculia bacterium]|nr:hypothetical protein [Thermoanaerobaculia bacterium]
MSPLRLIVTASLIALFLVAAGRPRGVSPHPPIPPLSQSRSFAVTETVILDGFPFQRLMAALGNPAIDGRFIPLALINRFDLTPADGSNCGQYRLIYAARGERLHLSFEGVLPNPNPAAGISACRPVARFWADLSAVAEPAGRRERLEQFFFRGMGGFAPLVRAEHFDAASGGGIRSFQPGSMRQFRLTRGVMEGGRLENTPPGAWFNAARNDANAARFRDEFVAQVPNLAVADVNRYFMNVPPELTVHDESGSVPFSIAFTEGLGSPEGQAFEARIAAELERIGSTLTPAEIVLRAETRTCTGCHSHSGPIGHGLSFPESLGLEHVSEDFMGPGPDGPRYLTSQAMWEVFIPNRMRILHDFLQSGAPPRRSN